MKKWMNKVSGFIKTGVWQKGVAQTKEHWSSRPLRIALYTFKGIGKHEIALRSAALTIYTVMSLVPVAALIFGILKGFGFDTYLSDYLYSAFPQYTNVVDVLMDFVNRMLARTRGGVIAAVGIIVLLWSVIKVFGNIEDAFNRIWDVKKGRSITRKFSDYIAVVFIAPVLLVASISLGTYIRSLLSFLSISWLIDILLWIASLILIWVLFAFIYWMMPNTKVKIKAAAAAAMVAGTAVFAFSLFYFYIQASVSSYNAIYGTFAAIPLFLAWLQTTWQLVLIGAELSFACQNVEKQEQERYAENIDTNRRRKILAAVMLAVVKHYLDNKGAVDAEEIAATLNLPVRIVRSIVYELEKAGLIVPVLSENDKKAGLYMPAKDVYTIRISDVIDKVENHAAPGPGFSEAPRMREVSAALDKIQDRMHDPEVDVYLVELIK